MTIAEVSFFSESLNRHTEYTALLPMSGDGPFPVLFMLHGATDRHTAWLYNSSLARRTCDIPLIIILPEGGLSYWINHNPRERYEDYLISDLRKHVAKTFHAREGKSAIGGLSMGGFGCLYQAIKHPDLFCSAWAHSPSVRTSDQIREQGPFDWNADPDEFDIFRLVGDLSPEERDRLPMISFDCGSGDYLIGNNRSFHEHLDTLGIPHNFTENQGVHDWDYWDAHFMEGIRQHCKVLGIDG